MRAPTFTMEERASLPELYLVGNNVSAGGGISRSFIDNEGANASEGAILNEAGFIELINCALISNEVNGGTATNLMVGQFGGVSGAVNGCAILNQGSLALVNCTLAEHRAVGGLSAALLGLRAGNAFGGALCSEGGDISLLNVTLATNEVVIDVSSFSSFIDRPSALGASIYATTSFVALTNTLLASPATQTNIWGVVFDGGHNLNSDASGTFTSSSSHGALDPLLGPLSDNGGPTPTLPLLRGGPAIDRADSSVCPAIDQRGASRPSGDGCDIGAFELTPLLSIVRAAKAHIQIEYRFQSGQTYTLSTSSDLRNWALFGGAQSDDYGSVVFSDLTTPKAPWRFYQVR